jgi:hypothetical protein
MPPQYLASSNSDNGRSAHELYEDSDANMDIDVETSPIEAAEVRETQEACGCRSLGQDAANSQPSNAAKPTQKPRRNQCNRCRFTNRLIKELKVCKEELQKSRGEAECFMKEKTVAEAAVESLIQKNETADAEIRVLRERLQKYLLQEAQDAKLKRQKLLSRTCAPDMSHSDIESERERIAKPFRRFAASKTPLPLHTVAASNGNSTGQVSRPTSGESGTTVSVENSPRRGGNRSGSVDILGTSNAENIREPSPMRRLMRRVSDGLLRKPHEKDSTVPPVPTLPISTSPAVLASTSVSPQLSEVHKTQEKRLTKDSGLGESIRTSIESAQPDTEPMEGLDSHFNVGSNEDTCMGMG